ncbi:hypothetical protein GCM10017691_61090 [Pseudonocardia petroleophila]|uniref:Heat shock protein beta n=1 Tax=Pseudonocardia petroleophila TaxID=37331 RepID=A0A7G7MM98_9PSEU|nr:hypothetical protein [Pseudonocardia petroleophila]QNG53909.1 hypothetical protein H6H00_08340 [Pseudonocardia petroleophila]
MSDIYYTSDGSIVELTDADGDGYQETTLVDQNADGVVDVELVDRDGDGYDDYAGFDNTPEDHRFQADVIAYDTAEEGGRDHRTDVVYDDRDFDGTFTGPDDTASHNYTGPVANANPYASPYGDDDVQATVNEVYDQR